MPKFKNSKLVKAAAMIMTFLGAKEIPVADGKVNFSEDQSEKLKQELSEGTFNDLIEAFNKDLAEEEQANSIRASLEEILKETDIPQGKLEEIVNKAKANGENDTLAIVKAIQNDLKDYKASVAETIKKLTDSAEEDTPEAIIAKEKLKESMKHSATHVFGSSKEWDAIDGRSWNEAAVKGLDTSATDFSDELVIQKLNGDASLYFRENPSVLKSLHRDNFQLPSFWPKRLKVDHLVSDGTIATAEITQGRKFGWLPKNVQEIQAETGQIYPVQIDAEWEGAELQKIETSWLNMLNKEGSQPEKYSFVRFLVEELMKRARVEDRISTLNGIFVQTPKTATKAGRFINRQNGLFYQLWKARDIDRKYRAFSMGEITAQNVYDWFHSDDADSLGFVKRLPQDVIAATNGVIYMHYKVWDWYKAKYKEINGTNMDYKGLPAHLENYPQIRVETFVDQENPNFVFFTFDDNIEILENIPQEKTAYRFQTLLRKIYMLVDYKLGVRLIHIGREVNPNDPEEFKVQSVWSNDAPIFLEDKFIPAFDDTTGKLSMNYKNVMVDETWATDITDITNVKPGQIVKIRGNASMTVSKKVKHNTAKIKLAGNADFDLQTGGTLVLVIGSDYIATELKRTTSAPAAPSSEVSFDDVSLNANLGTTFRYTGATDKTLGDILNGVEGKTIKIYGNATGDLTIATVAGEIEVGATPIVLDAATDYLEVTKLDGVWMKVNAVTA